MPGVSRPARILLFGTLLAAAACSTGPSMVLDSDLPAVPGLESVYARNLDRRDGALAGGRIVFRGRIEDAGDLLDRTLALYSAAGWTVLQREARAFSAEAVLAPDRSLDEPGSTRARDGVRGRRLAAVMRVTAGGGEAA